MQTSQENLSLFGQVALRLDGNFSELERISQQLNRLDIESDSGLDRAIKLLSQFQEHGQSLGSGIQEFAKTLEVVRRKSEEATGMVAERAQEIRDRKILTDQFQTSLNELGARVQELSGSLASFKRPTDIQSPEEKKRTLDLLTEIDGKFSGFSEEAKALQTSAAEQKLKTIARSAESLFGTLESARRKLKASASALT